MVRGARVKLGTAFIKELANTGQPPCEGCGHFPFCKYNALACGQFKHWVGQGDRDVYVPPKFRNKHPSRKFYNDIFTDFD
jgi:hypothetical protein